MPDKPPSADEGQFATDIISRLDEVLFWLRIAHRSSARAHFLEILDTPEKRQAYQLSDGNNTINAIMETTGVKSTGTISAWWDQWLAQGIVRESPAYKGRKQRVVDLADLGIE